MLTGECQQTIDNKGRMSVPQKFRSELGEKFVLTRGFSGCIFVYPMADWQALEEKLTELPLAEAKIQRFFLGGKEELNIDAQGRILVPQHLREHAALEKEIATVGVGRRIEIWDKSRWKMQGEEFNSVDGNNTLLERLDELGI